MVDSKPLDSDGFRAVDDNFPHVALLLLGGLAIAASFVKFSVVLDTLVALRIVVQFLGQIVAVVLLRRRRPDMPRPYRMWLYPLPLVLSAAGWLFVFGTLDPAVLKFVGAAVAAGVGSFLAWSRWNRAWPFEPSGK